MAQKNRLTKSDYLPMGEFKKLLKGLHKDHEYLWELYVSLSFFTALRASDIRTLTWADILNKSNLTKTEQKTGKTRKIPLSEQAQKRIDEAYLLLKRPNPAELIFMNPHNKKPYSIQYINRLIKEWRFKYQINIENFSTHTFRKSFGRYVYDHAEDKSNALILLNQIFKHSSIETTKVYLGLRADEINSVFASLRL